MKNKLILLILLNLATYPLIQGQYIKSLRSVNDGKFPEVKWYSPVFQDTASFHVYRSNIEKPTFELIYTLHGIDLNGDSLIFWMIDTTLTEKALYKYFITVPISKDSVLRSETMYGHNMGAIPSPQIVRFNAETSDNKKAINLSWELNYNFSVNTLAIFRSTNYDDGYQLIARVSGKDVAYTDAVDIANEAYFYFIVIHDYFGYQSPSVRIHGIATYQEKAIPPQSFKLYNKDDNAIMSWNKVGNNIIGYKVYRRINNFGSFFPLSKMFYTPNMEVNYTDSTVKDLQNKNIEYYIVSVSDGFIESNSTDTLTIHIQGEIFKASPQECNYVTDSLGRTMLIWTSQEADIEVKGYNVYYIQNNGEKVKLNKQLIPYNINYYVDKENTEIGKYTYGIETVSITNTPSATKAVAIVNKQDMLKHLILSLKKTEKGIVINAVPMNQMHIKEILLFRQVNSGDIKQITKLSPYSINYTDLNVKSGELYNYSAVAVYSDNSYKTVNAGVVMRY